MTTPYRFQRRDLRKVDRFGGRALIAWDMGTGKTYSSLLYAVNYLSPKGRIVVVCPASVKEHWKREAARHFAIRSDVLETRTPSDGVARSRSRIYIVNYDILGNPKARRKKTWVRFLRRAKPELVILDECHYLISRDSQRTRAVRWLCEGAPHVLALGGTPLTNNPAQLFPVLNILRPDRFRSFFGFAFEYTNPKKTPWGWKFKGGKNLEKLHRRLKHHVMVRRRKEDVLEDLPPKSRIVVPLPIKDRKEYDAAVGEVSGWLRATGLAKALGQGRAQALLKATMLKGLICRLKFDSVVSWVENFLNGSDGKLVVFASLNQSMMFPLYERFPDNSVLVTGKVRGKKRQEAVDRFVHDKKVRLFLGNVLAAGVGIDGLQQVCDTVAFADLAWTPGAHAQAEDRIYRIGQSRAVQCYYLIAEKTVEERLLQKIQDTQAMIDEVIDGRGDGGSTLNVFDEFLKVVMKGNNP